MSKNNTKKILIAIGSNLSNDLQESYDLVSDAIKTFNSETIKDIKISKFYETPAFPPGSGPNFINCVISGDTSLLPKELLNQLHLIEEDFGRTRIKRWDQRTLDIDLIDFDNIIFPNNTYVNEWLNMPLDMQKVKIPEQLILPHPRIQDRPFVLIPLIDVAPHWKHPLLNETPQEMLNKLNPELSIGISQFA